MGQIKNLTQDNKMLKKTYKKKAQQNQVLVAKAVQNEASAANVRTPTKDTGAIPT